MKIGQHELPAELCRLIQQDRWNAGTWLTALMARYGADASLDYRFLPVRNMEIELSNTRSFLEHMPDGALVYYLASSSATGEAVRLPVVDVDQCVPIIMVEADPYIWLDYRTGISPRVVHLGVTPEGTLGWYPIAENFGAFEQILLASRPR